MSADFTPGPWRFNGNWLEPVDYRGGDLILTYTSSDDGLHGKESDKALIAAAPDLYEALLAVLTDDEVTGGEVLSSAREAQVRAALAKARSAEFGNIGADGVQS